VKCPECRIVKCVTCYGNAECPIHGQMCSNCYYSNHRSCEESSSSSSSESSSSSSKRYDGCTFCDGP
jgi:hypothetical protein